MVIGKRLALLIFVVILPSWVWCQVKTRNSVRSKFKIDSVTALLNDSAWNGKAFALRESRKARKRTFEVSNYFDAGFLIHSPYTTYSSQGTTIDTTTQLVVSQWLSVSNIPLRTGIFRFSSPTQDPILQARLDLLVGGDAISESYYIKRGTDSWIRIIGYNLKEEIVTGEFKLQLVSKADKTIYFTNGTFKAKMIYEFK